MWYVVRRMVKSKKVSEKAGKSSRAENKSSPAGVSAAGDSLASQDHGAGSAHRAEVSAAGDSLASQEGAAIPSARGSSPAGGASQDSSVPQGAAAIGGEVSPAADVSGTSPSPRETAAGKEAAPGQPEEWSPEEARQQVELLRVEVEQKLSDAREAMLRQVAQARNDLTAMRQRTEKEQEKLRLHAVQDLASALLPVLDDLELAIAEAQRGGENTKPLAEGMDLIHRKVLEVFSGFNIRREHPEGSTFDPNLHEAVSVTESEGAEPNTVLEVLQSGYQLHDRLLRPARVVVAKGADISGEENERSM